MVKFLHPIYKRMKSVGATPEHRAFLEAIDNQLNDLEEDVKVMVSEMKIKEASGGWLDAWGDWYNVKRPSKMTSDDEYREYILREVTKPKNTIPGIVEEIERHLPEGSTVRVHEPYVDIFRFNISEMNMTHRIQDDRYTRHAVIDIIIDGPLPPYLNDIVKEVKSAGIQVYFTRDSSIWEEDEDGNLTHVRMYSLVEPSIGVFTHTQLEVVPMDLLYFNEGLFNSVDHLIGGREKVTTSITPSSELYSDARRKITTSKNTSFENIEDVTMGEEWLDDYFDAVKVSKTIQLIASNPEEVITIETVTTSKTTNLINLNTPFILGNSAVPVERYFDTPVEELYDHGERGEAEVYAGTPVRDGLVIWYDFSLKDNYSPGRERVTDLSGNGNHGILKNFSFTEGSGYMEEGLEFDNTDDYVNPVFSDPNNAKATSFTILSTVYFGGASGAMVWGGSPSAFYLRRNAGTTLHGSVFTEGKGQETRSATGVFESDKPAHANVGMIVDAEAMNMKFVIDGVVVEDYDLVGTSISPFLLTHVGTWPTLDYANLDGYMSSFQMYNRPLTPEEIQHNFGVENKKHNIK